MTAARSDLMALADQATLIVYNCTGKIEHQWQRQLIEKINKALRHAASQPDREALARIIDPVAFNMRPEMYGLKSQDELEAKTLAGSARNIARTKAGAILSLLSGAGTKSDGGCNCSWGCVEADNCRRKLGPLPDWKQDQSETSRIKPRPSDPSPGPDVKPAPIADSSEAGRGGVVAGIQPFEKHPQLAAHIVRLANAPAAFSLNQWNEFLAALNTALSAPVGEPVAYRYRYNGQWYLSQGKSFALNGFDLQPLYTHPPAPAVGPDVREALERAHRKLTAYVGVCKGDKELTETVLPMVKAALTRPLGGFVQGSIATKQESCPESAPRTETEIVTTLRECQRVLAMMIDPASIKTTSSMQAWAAATKAESKARTVLSGFAKSAPDTKAPHNSGERDPSVMPDFFGADTKSDGGAKVDSSPVLASKEDQRDRTNGMMPVGQKAATTDCSDAGPSDQLTKTPSADRDAGNLRDALSQGWQPIETAPRDGTRILVTGGGLGGDVEVAEYNKRVGCWNAQTCTLDDRDDEADGYSAPTHWMPLPALPSPDTTPRDSSGSTTGGAE